GPEEGRPGFPETHPLYRGALPPAIKPLCDKLEGHDLVVVIGAPVFRYYPYVAGDYLPRGTRLVQITDNASEAARAPVGDSILADPATACGVLVALGPAGPGAGGPDPAAPGRPGDHRRPALLDDQRAATRELGPGPRVHVQ